MMLSWWQIQRRFHWLKSVQHISKPYHWYHKFSLLAAVSFVCVYVSLKFNVFAKESLHARPWGRKAVPFEFKKWLRKTPYFGGITWFLGEQKGGSEVTESQKGRPMKFLEGFRGETTQICLEDEDMGVGSLQWNNIQRGDRLNFTVFSPKSSDPTPPPPSRNN